MVRQELERKIATYILQFMPDPYGRWSKYDDYPEKYRVMADRIAKEIVDGVEAMLSGEHEASADQGLPQGCAQGLALEVGQAGGHS